ncbi:MAG: hypothetical protein U0520_01510 [Candidatus Saccharimonadales bacterium]
MNTQKIVTEWLDAEYQHVVSKFGDHQSDKLRILPISRSESFAGQAATYWRRMRTFEDGNAVLQRAQAAAKVASSMRMLWVSVRALDWAHDGIANKGSLDIIQHHLGEDGFRDAKQFIGKDDFWETPIGIGSSYLESYIRRHGLAQKFRLPELVRAEQLMVDAADVAAVTFEDALTVYGAVPKPGISSGNIELWLPD